MERTPTREWFENVDSICSYVAYRRMDYLDELRGNLIEISRDARRFATLNSESSAIGSPTHEPEGRGHERTDERFAEWFEEAAQAGWPDAADFLTELRGGGFDIYRPDDCARTFITTSQAYERNVKAGIYRLVSVGGEG